MFDRCIYFNVSTLVRAITRIWEDAFAEFGLSPAHAYLLRYVLANPGQTQKSIADELELTQSTVTRFVDALVTRKLLVRGGSGANKREKIVNPTEKAESLRDGLEQTGQDLYKRMRKLLGPKNFDQLVGQVHAARDHIGAHESP